MIAPILRYPGNKWRFRAAIMSRLARYDGWLEFREPFLGAGAIGIAMVAAHPGGSMWFNDLDIGVYCAWKALRDHPDLLRRRVRDFVPSAAAYTQIRTYLRSGPTAACDHDLVHIGFCKVVLHCLSYSGIGLQGGPKRDIGRTWSPQDLSEKIARLQYHISHVRLTSSDYTTLVLDESVPCLLYLDPPYVAAGAKLYAHCFAGDQDHVALAQRLRCTRHQWVLSYDDCPQIRHLYQDWADIGCIPVKYTIRSGSVIKTELLISSKLHQ